VNDPQLSRCFINLRQLIEWGALGFIPVTVFSLALLSWKSGHDKYLAFEQPLCAGEVLKAWFKDFAAMPNKTIGVASGRPSGAKLRSGMTDALSEN